MRKVLIIPGVLIAVLIGLPVGFLIYLRCGPTAPVPTESPWIRLNREHENIEGNPADLYAEAYAHFTGEPDIEWEMGTWTTGEPMTPEAAEWVAQNSEAIAKTRAASHLPNFWIPLTHDARGGPELPDRSDLRALAELIIWRANLAADERDLNTLTDSIEVLNRMARHLSQEGNVISQLKAIAFLAGGLQAALVPYGWPDLSATDRATFARRVAGSFAPLPPLSATFELDCESMAWLYIAGTQVAPWIARLVPTERILGELTEQYAPIIELASQPIEQQLDPDNPLRQRVHELESAEYSWWNVPKAVAHLAAPPLLGVVDIHARLITLQRGNRTALELFAIRDQTGQFPASLDTIAGDFKIDPFSGRPFVYRLTDDSFALYSVGFDRDDDGGTHNGRFGLKRGKAGEPAPPPDGDYVFWPIVEDEPEDGPDDPD